MNYLAHWLIGKLEDWHQCSPEVWRVLMAGGALLVTALLLPLWRLPSNEQRHARVLSEWGNLQFWDSTAWFPKIWGIWGPQRFSIRTCIISSPHIPRPYPPYPPYKGGHHVLLQTLGKQSTHAASPPEIRRPPTKTGRPQLNDSTESCLKEWRVTGDGRPQAKGPSDSSDSSDLFWSWDSGMFGSLRACNMLHASLNSSHSLDSSLLAGRPDNFFLLKFRLGIG